MGYKDRKEKPERRPYNQADYTRFNKEWICVDDRGTVVAHGKDLFAASYEAGKKVGAVGFIIHYIDVEIKK